VVLAARRWCQSLPVAGRPEDVGISSQRLERVRMQMQADVESGRIPGAVLLIARNGKIAALDAVGFQDRKAQKSMKTDSIFRIASMSKPITSVAIMMLAEEGKVDIGAPVAQYLPEFKDVRVGVEKAAPKRPMTVQDLLRHTSGLTYGIFGNSPVDELYKKSGIFFTAPVAGRHGQATVAQPAAGASAGEVLGVQRVHGRFGTHRGSRQRQGAGPLRRRAHHRPAEDADTGFYLNARASCPMAQPDVPNHAAERRSDGETRDTCRAAAACFRPPETTRASAR
jgi:CubicO group peptidase (beta-lactamase class C family)